MSNTGNNVSNILCEHNIITSDIINGNANILMKNAYCSNAVLGTLWKCDMILEWID